MPLQSVRELTPSLFALCCDCGIRMLNSGRRRVRVWSALFEADDGRPFHKVVLRKQWVDHLVKNQTNSGLCQSAKTDLFDWVRQTRLSAEQLLAIWQLHA